MLFILAIFLLLFTNGANTFNCTKSESCQEEIQAMRIEQIKMSILNELGMSAPPTVDGDKMPSPAMRQHYQKLFNGTDNDIDNAFEPKKNKTFFVPAVDPSNGEDVSKLVAKFPIGDNISPSMLLEATLSFYANLSTEGSQEIDIQVFEKASNGQLGDMVAAQKLTIDQSQRISILLPSDYVTRWYTTEPIGGLFVIANCNGNNVAVHPQQSSNDYENMILQLTVSIPSRRRRHQHSSPQCSETENEEGCCLNDLWINFDEIGWDWVISPPTFNANLCNGNCKMSWKKNEPESIYSRLMSLTHVFGNQTVKDSIDGAVCCHPSQYDGLQMIHITPEGNIVNSYVSSMIVRSCNCG